MVTRGVPVEFPDLNFVIQESGVGWIPYFMERFDHEYHAKKYDAPMLEKEPSAYIDDNFYFTSQPVEGADTPNYLNQVCELFNAGENLMFSSDYPHFDHDEPNELLTSLSEFSDDEIENIYGKTAMDIYNI
jgi:predicted TIM-barrel fold metal-dependent hydrolase